MSRGEPRPTARRQRLGPGHCLDAVAPDELELLVSEIVTNALIHGQSAVDVRIRKYEDRLRVEVRDYEPHPPIPAAILDIEETRNDEAESGRGLLIVDAIASDWGSSPTGRGKTTWFEMLIPAA